MKPKTKKRSSRPADPLVAARERGAFAGDVAQLPTGKRTPGKPQNPHGPPPLVPYDIEVDEYDADTVPVFCKKNRFSVAFYYKMKLLGKTPAEMHLGRKRLISREAAREWRLAREAEAAASIEA